MVVARASSLCLGNTGKMPVLLVRSMNKPGYHLRPGNDEIRPTGPNSLDIWTESESNDTMWGRQCDECANRASQPGVASVLSLVAGLPRRR